MVTGQHRWEAYPLNKTDDKSCRKLNCDSGETWGKYGRTKKLVPNTSRVVKSGQKELMIIGNTTRE